MDALAVAIFHTELMAERGPPDPNTLHNPFSQSRLSIVSHSLQWFGRFAPNLAPYSVFPLPNEDCVGLMTGELWLFAYLNIGNVIRCLRRRGSGRASPMSARWPERRRT